MQPQENSNKGKTLKATLWSMLERFSTMGIQLISTLMMAQFLTPAEFGLISMLSIFLAFCNIIIDAGFSQALIRDQSVTEEDYSSVFYFNIIVGVILYTLFFIFAPCISSFYNEPRLTEVIRISFISILIFSTTAVQQARLSKDINFAKISKISLISVIISGMLGIIVAWRTHSVWAIVIQSLSFASTRSLLLWCMGNWKPLFLLRWNSIKKYLYFSLNLLATNIIAAITDNLPNLFIGKSYSASILGAYTVPSRLQQVLSGSISFSLHRVSYPIMAKFQDDIERLRDFSQKIVNMAYFIIAPLMTFLMVESHDLFDIILPSDWSNSAHYFRYLCVIGIVYCFADINMNVLMVLGLAKTILRIEITRKIIFIGVLSIGINYSIETLLTLLILYYIFNAIFVSYFYGRSVNCSLSAQFRNSLKTSVCLIIAGLITHVCSIMDIASVYRFMSSLVIFITLYLLTAKFLKDKSFEYIQSELNRRLCLIKNR